MPTAKTPTVGDPVLFEGMPCRIVAMNTHEGRLRFDTEMTVTRPDRLTGKSETVARFQTIANIADLKWSDDFKAWYMWGRVLGKGRGARNRAQGDLTGAVGEDQRQMVVEMRDRGVIPARFTRRSGQAPAGGEHVNLAKCLFHAKGVNWQQEMANVRRGDGLSDTAKKAVESYKTEFKKPLADGYAAPGANDSYAGEG